MAPPSAVHSPIQPLRARVAELERELLAARAKNERLAVELADAVSQADELGRKLAAERELRRALEAIDGGEAAVAVLERANIRHAAELKDAQANMNARLDAATIRHEEAIANLTDQHRREVARRLDFVIAQQNALFSRVSSTIQDLWTTRGTTRPSLDKEHWFMLAQEESEEESGDKVVTFKIHWGQKAYIDRIGSTLDVVVASPAANGVDIRQSTKKRMREKTKGGDSLNINALRYSCSRPDQVDGFLALLFESIGIAIAAPDNHGIDHINEEACENLRVASNLDTEIPCPAA